MTSNSPKRRKTNGKNSASSEVSVSSTDKGTPEFDVRATEFGLRPRRACTTKSSKKGKIDSDEDENSEERDNDYSGVTSSDDSDAFEKGDSRDKNRGGSKGSKAAKKPTKRSAPPTSTKKRSPAQKEKAPTQTKSAPAAVAAERVQNPVILTGPRPVGRPPVSGQVAATTVSSYSRGGSVPCMNPQNELTQENMQGVKLENNLNSRGDLDLQTLYVKIDTASESGMSALIGWAKVSDSNKVYFQCMFCPIIDKTARDIASHIRNDHHNVTFAVIKKVPPTNQLLFLYCRRCDYITVDTTSVWIHYAVHHGFKDMLQRTALPDITPPPTSRREVSSDDVATVFPFYKCSMCEFLATDNRYVAQHALMNHRTGDVLSDNNGCFVRVLKINKPKVLNPAQKLTYTQVAAGIGPDGVEVIGGVKPTTDTFVCVMCTYVSFCRYLAVTHHLRVHTGKYIMYKCSFDQCPERHSSPERMIQHLKTVHECGTVLHRHMRSQVTITEKDDSGQLREAMN